MAADDLNVSDQWRAWRRRVDLREYSERFDRMAAAGADVHGEVDFVSSLGGRRILDAGCGTGRVAIELHRRGLVAVGVDNDADMLAVAAAKAPTIQWVLGDLATVELDGRFDVVVMAGDVLNFVRSGFEPAVVANMARLLSPDGVLVVGASVTDHRQVADYDAWCAQADLVPVARYDSWDRAPFGPLADYAVSVHRRRDVTDR